MANGSLSSETSPGGQSSTFTVADFKTVNQQVQTAIADWDNGYQSLATVLAQALNDASNSPGPVHMVLVHAFESLVTSPVEVHKVVTFYNDIIDNLGEEGREKKLEVLAEAMADTVETVNEEVYKESLARRSGVDPAAADKSVDVLRELLVSVSERTISSHPRFSDHRTPQLTVSLPTVCPVRSPILCYLPNFSSG